MSRAENVAPWIRDLVAEDTCGGRRRERDGRVHLCSVLGAEPSSIPHLEPGAEDALVLPHAYEDAARSRGPPVALRLSLPTGSAVPFHSSEELEDGAGEETDREAPQAHRQSASARTQEDDRPTEAKEPSAPRCALVRRP